MNDILDCKKPEYIGDMFCDDITNNFECNFDGGDCCDPYSFYFACHHCICFDMTELENENTINPDPNTSNSIGTKLFSIAQPFNIFSM